MGQIRIAFFCCVTILASSQNHVTVVVPSTTRKGPTWERGVVEAGVYKNPSLGIELTSAPGLEFEVPELKGTPGTVPLLVTINAMGKPRLFSGQQMMAFYADALSYYAENKRTTDDYVTRVVRMNETVGWKPQVGASEKQFGGATFTRKDFQKEGRYEAVLMKTCTDQALVFIFAADDENEVNELVAGTKLNLGPASRCESPSKPTKPSR